MSKLRFGLVTSSIPALDIVKTGILAERHGFDSVWIPDHFTDLYPTGDRVEPWSVLSAIGANTTRVKLSTIVTDTQRSHPARTAHVVATLDELTGGRAMLGIGAGEAMNTLPYGLPFEDKDERVTRLREAVTIIRLLWTSRRDRRVNFDGKFFSLRNAVLDQRPVTKPAPPVYLGVMGTRQTLKLVGEVADGWMPWTNSPETFRRRKELITESATSAGRRIGSIDLGNVTSIALTEDSGLQRKAIAAMRGELLVTMHRRLLREMGFEVPAPEGYDYTYQRVLASEQEGDRAAAIAKEMPEELVRRFLIMGGPDEIIEGVDRYVKAGVRHVVLKDVVGMSLFANVSEMEKTLRVIGRKVIPYFRERG